MLRLSLTLTHTHTPTITPSQIQQIIIVVVPTLAPVYDNFLLLLVLCDGGQELLELSLGDLAAQLSGLRQHDESVLDVLGPLFLDEANAAEAVRCLRVKDLVEDLLSRFGFLLSRCARSIRSATGTKQFTG